MRIARKLHQEYAGIVLTVFSVDSFQACTICVTPELTGPPEVFLQKVKTERFPSSPTLGNRMWNTIGP